MPSRFRLAALLVGLTAGFAAADDAVTLKLKKPAKGDVTTETKDDSTTATVDVAVNGQKQSEEHADKMVAAYTDEVLAVDEKTHKPTKLTRTYEKLTATVQSKELKPDLAGKTVAVEKGKDGWTFTVDGKAVGADAEAVLSKEFKKEDKPTPEMEDVLLPKKAVKVGDTWAVDPKLLTEAFGETFGVDEDKVKASGTLKKLYEKDGAKFGVMVFTMDLPVTSLKTPMGNADAKAGSELNFTVTMDVCVDGTRHAGSMDMTMKGSIGMSAMGADVTVGLNGKMKGSMEPGKKK